MTFIPSASCDRQIPVEQIDHTSRFPMQRVMPQLNDRRSLNRLRVRIFHPELALRTKPSPPGFQCAQIGI